MVKDSSLSCLRHVVIAFSHNGGLRHVVIAFFRNSGHLVVCVKVRDCWRHVVFAFSRNTLHQSNNVPSLQKIIF